MDPRDVVALSFGTFVGVCAFCACAVALRAFSRWLTERFRPDMSRRYGRVPGYIERQLQEIADEEGAHHGGDFTLGGVRFAGGDGAPGSVTLSAGCARPDAGGSVATTGGAGGSTSGGGAVAVKDHVVGDAVRELQLRVSDLTRDVSELRAGILDDDERRSLRELGDRVRGLTLRVDELNSAAQMRATDAIALGARLDRFGGTLGSVLARLEELEGQIKVAQSGRASAVDGDVLYAEFSLASGGRAVRCDEEGRNPQLGGGSAVFTCDRVRGHAGQCHCSTAGGAFELTPLAWEGASGHRDEHATVAAEDRYIRAEASNVRRHFLCRCSVTGVRRGSGHSTGRWACDRGLGHAGDHAVVLHDSDVYRLDVLPPGPDPVGPCRAPAYVHTEEGVVTEECRLTAGHVVDHVARGACGSVADIRGLCRLPVGHAGAHASC